MAIFSAKTWFAVAVALPAAFAAAAANGGNPLAAAKGQPIALDAQSADVDLANNNVVFRKVRISQGRMSISADQGQGTEQAKRLDFDNSLWVFRGGVHIVMEEGQLNSDTAEIRFAHQQLATAVANGRPATFEEPVHKTGKLAQGHADTIDYDASANLVRLTRNAYLTDGQTEIRGELLKYNVAAQSIVADAADQGSQRVHIVITPPPQKQ